MIEVLAAHKDELENELRERVRDFFKSNDLTPQSVSVEMKFAQGEQSNGLSIINILVKDSCTGATLMTI